MEQIQNSPSDIGTNGMLLQASFIFHPRATKINGMAIQVEYIINGLGGVEWEPRIVFF